MADLRLEHITEEALRIVTTDRNGQYGEPEDSFCAIALLWNAYLEIKTQLKGERGLDRADVARMMELLKMARRVTAQEPKEDSYVDAIGYILCEANCAQ